MAGWASAARGELVVLTDGRVVKAASHRIVGDELEISVPGGGSFSVDRARVERIVQDEVLASEAPAPRPTPPPAIRPPVMRTPPVRAREETYIVPPPVPTPKRRKERPPQEQDTSQFGGRRH